MKKIISLALVTLFGCGALFSQNADGIAAIEKKLVKINAGIENPKKAMFSKTWLERARAYSDLYNVNMKYVRMGASPAEIKMFFKMDPSETLADKQGKEKHVYPYLNLFYTEGQLSGWDDTKYTTEKPLDISVESYKKALELTPDLAEAKTELQNLKVSYEQEGMNAYGQNKYSEALANFEKILAINAAVGIPAETDTSIIFYCGFMAMLDKKSEKAIEYLDKAVALQVSDPAVYEFLYTLNMEKQDTLKALDYLRAGYEKFPTDKNILLQLIQGLIDTNNANEAIEKIQSAKTLDPTNKLFPFVEGTLYEKLGDIEKAVAGYSKAVELDPNFYDALYNVAVFYYNNGVKLVEAANDEKDEAEFQKKLAEGNEFFKKAMEPLEKCRAINPKGEGVLSTLKSLYYRFKMEDKLKEVQAALDAL